VKGSKLIQAAAFYRVAALAGCTEAKNSLGFLIWLGYNPTEKDYAAAGIDPVKGSKLMQAAAFYRVALAGGCTEAGNNLGILIERGYLPRKDDFILVGVGDKKGIIDVFLKNYAHKNKLRKIFIERLMKDSWLLYSLGPKILSSPLALNFLFSNNPVLIKKLVNALPAIVLQGQEKIIKPFLHVGSGFFSRRLSIMSFADPLIQAHCLNYGLFGVKENKQKAMRCYKNIFKINIVGYVRLMDQLGSMYSAFSNQKPLSEKKKNGFRKESVKAYRSLLEKLLGVRALHDLLEDEVQAEAVIKEMFEENESLKNYPSLRKELMEKCVTALEVITLWCEIQKEKIECLPCSESEEEEEGEESFAL